MIRSLTISILAIASVAASGNFAIAAAQIETEFRGDHHLVANRGQRFAHQFFIGERTVHFGGVEERYAAFDSRTNQRDHLFLVRGRTKTEAHSHAAESDGRHFQTFSKFALLHYFSLWNHFCYPRLVSIAMIIAIPLLPIEDVHNWIVARNMNVRSKSTYGACVRWLSLEKQELAWTPNSRITLD